MVELVLRSWRSGNWSWRTLNTPWTIVVLTPVLVFLLDRSNFIAVNQFAAEAQRIAAQPRERTRLSVVSSTKIVEATSATPHHNLGGLV